MNSVVVYSFRNSVRNIAYSQGCSFFRSDFITLILLFPPCGTLDIMYSIVFLLKLHSHFSVPF